jgi:hypothetical protein
MGKYKINPLLGDEFDLVGSSTIVIPELTADPTSPVAGETWVKRSGGLANGGVIKAFLGGAFPVSTVASGTPASYELSYKTIAGTIVRTTLS